MPTHRETLREIQNWILQGKTPIPSTLYFRLTNALLMRLTSAGSASAWASGNYVHGQTSSDKAIIYEAVDNDDGSVTLVLRDFTDTAVFSPGETVDEFNGDPDGSGSSTGDTGVIDNATLTLLNQSGGPFRPNETISISGTTVGQIVTVGPDMVTIQETAEASIAEGNTITGDESASTADINEFNACEPGLLKTHTISDIAGSGGIYEPGADGEAANGYAPLALAQGTTDWPDSNESFDGDDNAVIESVTKTFSATDGTSGYGPFNVGFLADQEYESTFTYSGLSGTFSTGETVTGGTSGATAVIRTDNGTDTMEVDTINGSFTDGESISGGTSGASATLDTQDLALVFMSSALKNTPPSRKLNGGENANVSAIWRTSS